MDLCTENCLQHLKAIPAVRRCNKTGVVTRYSRTGNIRLREEHDCLVNEIRRARDPKPCTFWLRQVNACNSELNAVAMKAFMVIPSLLLQKPSKTSKAKDHSVCLSRRLIYIYIKSLKIILVRRLSSRTENNIP